MSRRLLIAVAFSTIVHVALGISMWRMERPEKAEERRIIVKLTQQKPKPTPQAKIQPKKKSGLKPLSQKPKPKPKPKPKETEPKPLPQRPKPAPIEPGPKPLPEKPKPAPKPVEAAKPPPRKKKEARKKVAMPSPPAVQNRELDDRPAPKPVTPRKIGLNLDGSVTAKPGGDGVALPEGDGFPTPGDDLDDWDDGTNEDGRGADPEDRDGAEDGAEDAPVPEDEAAGSKEIAEEARETLEEADADGDGKLDESEKAEQIADRKHDRIETKSLRKIRTKPKVKKNVQPPYPEELRELEVEGVVALELVIDEEGKVSSVKILRRLHPTLDDLAREAAMKLEFTPATVNGAPAQVKIPWEFAFVIE
ncbi:MAG: energy transducer TonB [Pseudomonadota bacterium]